MISPAYCRGCDFWRDVASYTGCYQVCHYSMDTGTTRTRLGQLDVCQVRQVGGVRKARAKAHKYDVTRKPKAGRPLPAVLLRRGVPEGGRDLQREGEVER